jgi:TIR domain
MIGLRGSVRSSARVLPSALPPLRQSQTVRSPLAPLVQNSAGVGQHGDSAVITKEYDVFISHASEDKDSVVRSLAHALRALDLKVWYDEFELRIGDNLRRKIDSGLANSRFGVVVLSPSFFAKGWSNYELDGLVTREMTGQQVILPLWHNITRLDLIKVSPSLVDKLARSTSDYTIDEIATEIAMVVFSKKVEEAEEWEEASAEEDDVDGEDEGG